MDSERTRTETLAELGQAIDECIQRLTVVPQLIYGDRPEGRDQLDAAWINRLARDAGVPPIFELSVLRVELRKVMADVGSGLRMGNNEVVRCYLEQFIPLDGDAPPSSPDRGIALRLRILDSTSGEPAVDWATWRDPFIIYQWPNGTPLDDRQDYPREIWELYEFPTYRNPAFPPRDLSKGVGCLEAWRRKICPDNEVTVVKSSDLTLVSSETDPPKDGPVAPNEFWWQGKKAILAPRPYKVIEYVWSGRNRSRKVEDVENTVWPGKIGDASLRSAMRTANAAFLKSAMPVQVQKTNGYVQLSVDAG